MQNAELTLHCVLKKNKTGKFRPITEILQLVKIIHGRNFQLTSTAFYPGSIQTT